MANKNLLTTSTTTRTAHQLGRTCEDLAVRYLQAHHFNLLTRNYQYQKAEIDIIATKDNCLHFVEVKARSNLAFGYPETFVSPAQQQRIKMAAENYMLDHGWQNAIRFDILAVIKQKNRTEIVYFEDAFV